VRFDIALSRTFKSTPLDKQLTITSLPVPHWLAIRQAKCENHAVGWSAKDGFTQDGSMTEDAATEPQRELVDLWREWLTLSERQMNEFLGQAMSTDTASRSMGSFVEMYALFQRNIGQAMERYLATMNIPSRTDIIALGEKLGSIEERLLHIEQTLLIAAESVDDRTPTDRAAEPSRTRQSPVRDGSPTVESGSGVPEELRR
jgi:hypothetical protein